MAFTSRIGNILSEFGAILLGGPVTTLSPNPSVTIPTGYTPHYLTGMVGNALSQPGNIIPGRAFTRLFGSQSLTANLTPTGSLNGYQYYTGTFRYSSVGTFRAIARVISFVTQPRVKVQ